MSTESRDKDRISFQEVAKLAATPDPSRESGEKKKDDSGMIDLAALATGDASAKQAAATQSPSGLTSGGSSLVGSHQVVVRELPSVSLPAPTSPMFFESARGTVRPPATGAIRPARDPFGSASPTLPGVGRTATLASPGSVASRPVPHLPAPAMRLPPIAVVPSLGPRHPALPAETTRPTTFAANSDPKRAAGAVWIALGGGIGLGALAAGIFFQMHGAVSSHSGQVVATPAAPSATALTAATASNPASGGALSGSRVRDPDLGDKSLAASADPQGSAVTVSDPTPSAEALTKHAVPTTQLHPSDPSSATAPSPALGLASAPPAPAAAQPATASAAAPAPARPSAPASASNDQSLDALMRRAVGIAAQPAPSPPSSPPVGAESPGAAAAGNVPIKPAMGAVQGAVGAVLPATRYCLGPDDPISHATITFKSDGSVQTVAVSGAAAGQPAEECIRSRLTAARVPPFSSPSFTWSVTVRPAS
jgi:hypothetical protein